VAFIFFFGSSKQMSVFNARLGRRDFSCWLYFSDKSSRWRFNNPRFASFTVKLPTFNDTLLVRLFLAFLTVANLTIWEPNAVAEINFNSLPVSFGNGDTLTRL